MSATKSVFRLAAGPNNYDWGPIGAAKPGYEVKKDEPYSEVSRRSARNTNTSRLATS
jgi:hypothetical protein